MYLWPFTNLIFTNDTASTAQHHAINRRTQKKWGGVTPPTPPYSYAPDHSTTKNLNQYISCISEE